MTPGRCKVIERETRHRKMALVRQREALLALIKIPPVCCVQKSLLRRIHQLQEGSPYLVLATPSLLADTPSRHTVGISCSAVIRLGCCGAANLARAAPVVHFAAPRLLSDRPTHLPIGISVSAIVRVCRSGCATGMTGATGITGGTT
eukprot:UN20485